MSAAALTRAPWWVDHDPMRDKSYRDTALGPEIVAWLAWCRLEGMADRTLEDYERYGARLALMFPRKGFAELTDGDLMACLNTWPRDSRRTRKSAIATLYDWAFKTHRIEVKTTDYLPRIRRRPQRVIDTFSDSEISALLDLPALDGGLMAVLVGAGLRKAEARGLQVRRVKVSPPAQVIVLGKGDKERIVPVEAHYAQRVGELLLLEQLEPRDHLWYARPGGGGVFRRDRPVSNTAFVRWWDRCLKDAGVRYRNPHVARHTYATRYLRRGGRLHVLSRVMGHASIQTTADLYAHLDTRDFLEDLATIEEWKP